MHIHHSTPFLFTDRETEKRELERIKFQNDKKKYYLLAACLTYVCHTKFIQLIPMTDVIASYCCVYMM